MPTGKHIKQEDIQDIVCYYQSEPMTIEHCAKHFGLCAPTVMKALDAMGVTRYTKARIFNPNLDEDYFSEINTEAKAYYLGLIIADGNVFYKEDGSNRQASISISQSESDSYILSNFLNEIHSNNMVGSDGRGTCCAAVRSNKMAEDLATYGVVQNKTFHAYLPSGIDDGLMNHLFRGILDGDGCIQSKYSDNGKHRHSISFCGTHQLMTQMTEYLHNEIGTSLVNVYDYKNRKLSEFKLQSKSDVETVGLWMYDKATVFLRRKREKFDDFLNYLKTK